MAELSDNDTRHNEYKAALGHEGITDVELAEHFEVSPLTILLGREVWGWLDAIDYGSKNEYGMEPEMLRNMEESLVIFLRAAMLEAVFEREQLAKPMEDGST